MSSRQRRDPQLQSHAQASALVRPFGLPPGLAAGRAAVCLDPGRICRVARTSRTDRLAEPQGRDLEPLQRPRGPVGSRLPASAPAASKTISEDPLLAARRCRSDPAPHPSAGARPSRGGRRSWAVRSRDRHGGIESPVAYAVQAEQTSKAKPPTCPDRSPHAQRASRLWPTPATRAAELWPTIHNPLDYPVNAENPFVRRSPAPVRRAPLSSP
jgi:hypothetical protein